ncbi:GNAT family N-acetyltransferase [Hansschlegelia beijingensis]|uniref:GNAT family N-acetyltransferase n=1 Tax=Hansschlegelia beijingensis TaxID=1133344 RepID=UPI00387F0383
MSIDIHRDGASALGPWSELLRGALATPYQKPGLLLPWIENVAAHEGVQPLIVVARDETGAAVALLPFGVSRRWGVTVARFLGGSHMNYNVPVIRRDHVELFDRGEVDRLFSTTAGLAGIDLFELTNQPEGWEGVRNPFMALPRQPSPDPAFSGPLAASLEEHLKLFVSAKSRSNQRRKMRRFEERGRPHIFRADTDEQRRRLLAAFLSQKAQQFAERGIDNVFAHPGVPEFLSEACGLTGRPAVIDLYGFDLDDETIAVTGGLADAERYCGMFISITSGEHAKYSPGEMLMNFVVEDSIRRGLRTFDLGVGAATYKKMYCPDLEPLYDSIFGLTLRGRALAAAAAAKTAAKARIKANPTAYALVEKIRALRAGRAHPAPDAD